MIPVARASRRSLRSLLSMRLSLDRPDSHTSGLRRSMVEAKPACSKGGNAVMGVGDPYRAMHARSLGDPEGFWAEQAAAIDWTRRWDTVLDAANPPFYRWFAGAELNTCYNALDRHVERGPAEPTARSYDSPRTPPKKNLTHTPP